MSPPVSRINISRRRWREGVGERVKGGGRWLRRRTLSRRGDAIRRPVLAASPTRRAALA